MQPNRLATENNPTIDGLKLYGGYDKTRDVVAPKLKVVLAFVSFQSHVRECKPVCLLESNAHTTVHPYAKPE